MPISNTKDVIKFVNELESRINSMTNEVEEWSDNKFQIITALPQIDRNRVNAVSAIVKAEDALAELNTATYGVVAAKGQRLKKLLDDLKEQLIEIAENAEGKGGAEPYIRSEVDNAIAGVDSVIADGLKLDYRIRGVQDMAQQGVDLADKDVIMPFNFKTVTPLNYYEVTIPADPNIEFVRGDVTVLDERGERAILGVNGQPITGTIYESGLVVLTEEPKVPVTLIYPGRLSLRDIPEDFLYYMLQTMLTKSSPTLTFVQKMEAIVTEIVNDIRAMKGGNWTVDYSIMRNQKEIVKESITPKGLSVQVQNGTAHATFSYNDHPNLSHFVLEKLDPATNEYKPYDDKDGIIGK